MQIGVINTSVLIDLIELVSIMVSWYTNIKYVLIDSVCFPLSVYFTDRRLKLVVMELYYTNFPFLAI